MAKMSHDIDNGKFADRKSLLNHAWKYFEIHADQRIQLFRFYIGFLVVYLTAAGFLFIRFSYEGKLSEVASILFSIVFAVITIIFHLLDKRNHQLIHYSENIMRDLENDFFPEKYKANVFTKEYLDVVEKKSCIGHTFCFRIIYILAYIMTGIIILTSVFCFCYF